MSTTTCITAPQDEIRFKLSAESTVTIEDALVSLTLTALVRHQEAEPARLGARILDALVRFIDTNWTVALTERSGEPTGHERVTVRVYARVPSQQIYDLEQRAKRSLGEGLAASAVAVDFTLPRERIDALVNALRVQLLETASAVATDYTTRSGRNWRIGTIDFGVDDETYPRRRTGKGAAIDLGDEFVPGSAANPAERVRLLAQVALRAWPDAKGSYLDDIAATEKDAA